MEHLTWAGGLCFTVLFAWASSSSAAIISGTLHPPSGLDGLGGPSSIRASNGGGSVTTFNGSYALTVSNGWSGVVVIERDENGEPGVFSPGFHGYTNLAGPLSGQDFTILAAPPGTLKGVSGWVTNSGGDGVEGVLVAGSANAGAALTSSNGYYRLGILAPGAGWTGAITPSGPGLEFTPASRAYGNVTSDLADQDYLASGGGGGEFIPPTDLPLVATNKIVFNQQVNGDSWNLFVMDIDGHNQRQLTASGYWDSEPQFSPDGSKLVFARVYSTGMPRSSAILEINANGTGETNLSAAAGISDYVEYPSWSYDGRWITFQRQVPGQAMDIWIMRADGTDARAVVGTADNDQYPSFSPDGQWIVFKRETAMDPNPRSKICKVNLSRTNDVLSLTPDGSPLDETPVYSRDGQFIVFKRGYAADAGGWDWFRMPADHDPANLGDVVPLLGDPTMFKESLIYTWEGDRIVFCAGTSAGTQSSARVFIMDADGSNRRQLTDNNAANWDATVSPRVYASKPPPSLAITLSGSTATVSWPADASGGWQLEATTNLAVRRGAVTNLAVETNGWYQVSVPVDGPTAFYRLRQ